MCVPSARAEISSGSAAHRKDQRIQGVDAISAEPTFRPERRWLAEFTLVKFDLRPAPALLAAMGLGREKGGKKPSVVTAHRGESTCPRCVHHFLSLDKRRRDGLFDKEMLARAQSGKTVLVMQRGAGEYIDCIDVRARQCRGGIAALF